MVLVENLWYAMAQSAALSNSGSGEDWFQPLMVQCWKLNAFFLSSFFLSSFFLASSLMGSRVRYTSRVGRVTLDVRYLEA